MEGDTNRALLRFFHELIHPVCGCHFMNIIERIGQPVRGIGIRVHEHIYQALAIQLSRILLRRQAHPSGLKEIIVWLQKFSQKFLFDRPKGFYPGKTLKIESGHRPFSFFALVFIYS